VPLDSHRSDLNFVVAPGAMLTGRVQSEDSTTLWAGAAIFVYVANQPYNSNFVVSTTSDAGGRYALPLQTGTYRILVSAVHPTGGAISRWYQSGTSFATATDVTMSGTDRTLDLTWP
jgi:hypothetical protein